MKRKIGWITLLVRDYDEAIAFYTEQLRFDLVDDTALDDGKRWIVVAPPNAEGSGLLLAEAASAEQLNRIGGRAGISFSPYGGFLAQFRRYEIAGCRISGRTEGRNLRNRRCF